MSFKKITESLDSNMNSILNYLSEAFNESHSDGGYAIRAIEIKRFNKIKPLCQKFKALTGYDVPYAACNAEELNLLVERGLKVISFARAAYDEELADLKNVEAEMENAKRGKRGGFGGHETLRAHLQDLEFRKDRIEDRIIVSKKWVTERRELLGMLRQEAELLSANNTHSLIPAILTYIPIEYLKGCPVKESFFDKSSSPILYAWKELDSLETALQRIITLCSTPTDKYELSHGGEKKSQYNRKYYSVEGAEIRQRMTAIDYVNSQHLHDERVNKKIHMMNSPI